MIISRTGYTGDLGYELWFGAEHALKIWDVLIEQGSDFGIKPTGILALDVARLEAGFILLEVDYIGAEKALIESQRYSPFEIGLGSTVDLRKDHFVGAKALRQSDPQGPARQIVGLEIDLLDYEYLYQAGRIGAAISFGRLARQCAVTQKRIARSAMRPPAPGRRR